MIKLSQNDIEEKPESGFNKEKYNKENNLFNFFMDHFYELWEKFEPIDQQTLNILTDYGLLDTRDTKRWQRAIKYMYELWRLRFGGIALKQAAKSPTLVKLSDFVQEADTAKYEYSLYKRSFAEDANDADDSAQLDEEQNEEDATVNPDAWNDVANRNLFNEFKILKAVNWSVKLIHNTVEDRTELIAYDSRIAQLQKDYYREEVSKNPKAKRRTLSNLELRCRAVDKINDLPETTEINDLYKNLDATLVLKYAPIMNRLGFETYSYSSNESDSNNYLSYVSEIDQWISCKYAELRYITSYIHNMLMKNGDLVYSPQITRNNKKVINRYQRVFPKRVNKYNIDVPQGFVNPANGVPTGSYTPIAEEIVNLVKEDVLAGVTKLYDETNAFSKLWLSSKDQINSVDDLERTAVLTKARTLVVSVTKALESVNPMEAPEIHLASEEFSFSKMAQAATRTSRTGNIYLPFFRTADNSLINKYKDNPDLLNNDYIEQIENVAKSLLASYSGIYQDRSGSIAQFSADEAAYSTPLPEETKFHKETDLISGRLNPDGTAKTYFEFQAASIRYTQEEMEKKGSISMMIADDMGSGKTQQALGIINNNPNLKKILIVTTGTLKDHWAKTALEDGWIDDTHYTQGYNFKIFDTATLDDIHLRWLDNTGTEYAICVIHYQLIARNSVKYAIMGSGQWDAIILDESHTIANSKGNVTAGFIGKEDTGSMGSVYIVDDSGDYRVAETEDEFAIYDIARDIHKFINNSPGGEERKDRETALLAEALNYYKAHKTEKGAQSAYKEKKEQIIKPTPDEIARATDMFRKSIDNVHDSELRDSMLLDGDAIALPGFCDVIKNKICLTGTPIKNKTEDLYAQLMFLNKKLYKKMWPTLTDFLKYTSAHRQPEMEIYSVDHNENNLIKKTMQGDNATARSIYTTLLLLDNPGILVEIIHYVETYSDIYANAPFYKELLKGLNKLVKLFEAGEPYKGLDAKLIQKIKDYNAANDEHFIEKEDDAHLITIPNPTAPFAYTKPSKLGEFNLIFRHGINVGRSKNALLTLPPKQRFIEKKYTITKEELGIDTYVDPNTGDKHYDINTAPLPGETEADRVIRIGLLESWRAAERTAFESLTPDEKEMYHLLEASDTPEEQEDMGDTLEDVENAPAKETSATDAYANFINDGFTGLINRGQVMTVKQCIGKLKAKKVVQIVQEILSENPEDKLVLFAHHRDVADMYYEGLRAAGIPCAYFNKPDQSTYENTDTSGDEDITPQPEATPVATRGKRTPKSVIKASALAVRKREKGTLDERRANAKKLFERYSSVKVFLSTMGIGKEGLNLTIANHLVFGEIHFVPGVMMQSEDRISRIGQTKPTNIYYVTFEDSYDSRIAQIIKDKIENIEKSIQAMQVLTEIRSLVMKNNKVLEKIREDAILAAQIKAEEEQKEAERKAEEEDQALAAAQAQEQQALGLSDEEAALQEAKGIEVEGVAPDITDETVPTTPTGATGTESGTSGETPGGASPSGLKQRGTRTAPQALGASQPKRPVYVTPPDIEAQGNTAYNAYMSSPDANPIVKKMLTTFKDKGAFSKIINIVNAQNKPKQASKKTLLKLTNR